MRFVLLVSAVDPSLLVPPAATPLAVERVFTEEAERDLPLKRQVPLSIVHSLGKITMQGWVQDRIRVTIKKRLVADSENDAKEEFKKLDLITLETAKSFELRVGHARGADLVTKLRDEKKNRVMVDLEIKAPYQMDLTVTPAEEKTFSLQQWKGAISLTGKNAKLEFMKLNLQKPMKVSCQNCDVSISDSRISGHLLVGSRPVELRNVSTESSVFIGVSSGEVKMEGTHGKFSIQTTSGKLSSANHQGDLSFQSEDGGVFVTGLNGNMEASTQSGQIMVEAEIVQRFLHFDSDKSDIQIALLPKFEGLLDLLSLHGEVMVQFPHENKKQNTTETYGPLSPGRLDASVGNAKEVTIHAYSKQGGVRILRKVPKR